MHLLLVEDDQLLGQGIEITLRNEGYQVDWVRDGKIALDTLLTGSDQYDGLILDLGLPSIDGLQILSQIRNKGISLPTLILTARDSIEQRVTGLDAGADDYLVKPFDIQELYARIRVMLRREQGRSQTLIHHEQLTLNPSSMQVWYADQEVILTRKEYFLLLELMSNSGRVQTRDHLEQTLYGIDEDIESNALEVHIHKLRKKISSDLIKTLRGVGYMIENIIENTKP